MEPGAAQLAAPGRRPAEHAGSSEATPPLTRGDEVELGAWLVATLQRAAGGVAPVACRGQLWAYQSTRGIWAPVEDERAGRLVQGLAGSPIGDKCQPLRLSDRGIRGAVRCAHRQVADPGWLDAAPPGVAVGNGFLALSPDGLPELQRPHPDHRATFALAADYEAVRPAGLWGRFLAASFRSSEDAGERQRFLAQFVGACLFGLATKHQRFALLAGPGGTGKSTFLDVIAALFPPSVVTAIPPQSLDSDYHRAALSNARLNLVSELPDRDLIDVSSTKAAVVGDAMRGRLPYGAPFTFRPHAGHLWAANALPQVLDPSGAWWRRVVVVEFRDRPEAPVRDLAARLVRDELATVLTWAVDGVADLESRRGYALPSSAERAAESWRYAGDVVAQWLAEAARRTSGEVTTAGSTAYQHFRDWCQRRGNLPLAANKWAARLEAHGVAHRREARAAMWALDLLHDDD